MKYPEKNPLAAMYLIHNDNFFGPYPKTIHYILDVTQNFQNKLPSAL